MSINIKWRQADRGDWVPFVDDRALASTRDPRLEAIRWVQALPTIREESDIAVLGLGAGFHVAELARAFPNKKIFAFENHTEICDKFKKNFPELAEQVEVVDLSEYQKNPFDKSFGTIVHFRSAQQSAGDVYKKLYEHLVGVNGKLNIKEIIDTLDEREQSFESKIWRALREFVK